MGTLQSSTRAFGSVRRYIQGPGEIDNLKNYTKPLGSKVYALISTGLFTTLKARLEKIYTEESDCLFFDEFSGEITYAKLDEKTANARNFGAELIVAAGGGKVVDAAKIIAKENGIPVVLIPTIASTDAPVASMSAVFNDAGEQQGIVLFQDCPDIVLVDSELIAQAPVRYFIAGVGDALATCFEAKLSAMSDSPNFVSGGKRFTLAGMAICEACEKTIMEKAEAAVLAVRQQLCTPDVEDVIEANTLLSGLGFINVGLCGAHATNTGLTVLTETQGTLHGELVAFGIIVQRVVEQRPLEEIAGLISFMRRIGLPTTLEELGVHEMTEEMLDRVTTKALSGFWKRYPYYVSKKSLGDAIMMANALGHKYSN